MVRLAQEIQAIAGREGIDRVRTDRMNSLRLSKTEEQAHDAIGDATVRSLALSSSILTALGDEPSRRILASAIASGKTVEEISAEQNLPLSTCYRRVRSLLGEGLMILERTVVTHTGKRYAIYRTSFSKAAIRFNGGEIALEVTPNLDIIDKLRRRWLSANYPLQNQDDRRYGTASEFPHLADQISGPFE